MKVVFDARCIDTSISRPSIYIRELLARMPVLDPASSWHVIFADEATRDVIMCDARIAGLRNVTTDVLHYSFSSVKGNFRLAAYLMGREFDVYFSPVVANSFLALGGFRGRCRATVVTVHTLPGLDRRNPLMSSAKRYCLRYAAHNCDAMIAVSRTLRNDIVKNYSLPRAVAEKVHVVFNGVSEMFSPPEDPMPPADVGTVVYLGNHRAHKNIPTLIRAFAALRRKTGRKLHLLLGGSEGAVSVQERSLVRDLGIAEHVTFLGEVPEKDLPSIYNEVTLVVSPSSYEGFPYALLEAMRSGTPIVCCDGGAQREFAGCATDPVQPKDMQSLCDAMDRMISDESLRAKCVAAGIPRAKEYTWDRTAAGTLDILHRVLAAKNGGDR